MNKLIAATLATLPLLALAHEGHGMPGAAHWHATDGAGLLLMLAAAGGLCWFARRK